MLKEPIATVDRTELNNHSRYSLPRNYRNHYSFNISGVNTKREDCVVYMGHYFAILTPKTTMASKYRDGSNKPIEKRLEQVEKLEESASISEPASWCDSTAKLTADKPIKKPRSDEKIFDVQKLQRNLSDERIQSEQVFKAKRVRKKAVGDHLEVTNNLLETHPQEEVNVAHFAGLEVSQAINFL